jgi:uncharacterized protein (DUF1697 family)
VKPYVAFLRGMNLGKRRIKNPELVEHFEALGLEEVATFRASGNVVFADPSGDPEAKLQGRLERGLDQRLGYDVAVFLRSFEEVAAIAAREPFDAQAIARSKGKPQVQLLAKQPSATAKKKVLALAGPDDEMTFKGRELHWLPSTGLSETEVDLKQLDRILGRARCEPPARLSRSLSGTAAERHSPRSSSRCHRISVTITIRANGARKIVWSGAPNTSIAIALSTETTVLRQKSHLRSKTKRSIRRGGYRRSAPLASRD